MLLLHQGKFCHSSYVFLNKLLKSTNFQLFLCKRIVCILVIASLRNLRHERDMLYKQMLRRLNLPERESLYSKWGIDLNSKQRRLQLSRRIWTQTDMEHVRESAALVTKLVEHLEKGQAIKEMFGLSFTLNPRGDRRTFSWVSAHS